VPTITNKPGAMTKVINTTGTFNLIIIGIHNSMIHIYSYIYKQFSASGVASVESSRLCATTAVQHWS
jgi:hypothetical protein